MHGLMNVKKYPAIRIFCMTGWIAILINPDKCSCTVFLTVSIGMCDANICRC